MTWNVAQSGRRLVPSLGGTEPSVYIDISSVRNIEVKERIAVISLELTIRLL